MANKFYLEELKDIIGIREVINIDGNNLYDSFSMVKDVNVVNNPENVLFFPIKLSVNDQDGGWYINDFDGSAKINNYIKANPEFTFVVTPEIKERIDVPGAKLIVVDDVMESIDKLFNYVMEHRDFKSILVTGSVGKTSCVGLIEKVIGDRKLRIYSKRITPIILKANIINKLTEDIDYVIFEASMFHRHHVKYFSETMHPYISVILNILEEHLGIDGIESLEDITKCKIELLKYCKYALLNRMDKELAKVELVDGNIVYEADAFKSNVEEIHDISGIDPRIQTPIKTLLTKLQFEAAFEVGKILGIEPEEILTRLNNSSFVENRLSKKIINGHEVIFDGDVTGIARFDIFTAHTYDRAVLVLNKLTNIQEENEDYTKIKNYFDRFEKVYVFASNEFADILTGPNVEVVEDNSFIKDIDPEVEIFYHYGNYYRIFGEFDVANLEEKKDDTVGTRRR